MFTAKEFTESPMTAPTIEYYGLSSYSIKRNDLHLLVDPWFTGSAWDTPSPESFDDVDYILVTHGAYDHLGDTVPIANGCGAHVITEPAVADHLLDQGIPAEQVTRVIWGNQFDVGDVTCRALETRHLSYFESGNQQLSGTPLGFYFEFETVGIYYLGDTSIFSDLKLFGELYAPQIALVPIGAAPGARAPLPPQEAATVTEWLGVDTVVPVHYVPGSTEIDEFTESIMEIKPEERPEIAALEPTDRFTYDG